MVKLELSAVILWWPADRVMELYKFMIWPRLTLPTFYTEHGLASTLLLNRLSEVIQIDLELIFGKSSMTKTAQDIRRSSTHSCDTSHPKLEDATSCKFQSTLWNLNLWSQGTARLRSGRRLGMMTHAWPAIKMSKHVSHRSHRHLHILPYMNGYNRWEEQNALQWKTVRHLPKVIASLCCPACCLRGLPNDLSRTNTLLVRKVARLEDVNNRILSIDGSHVRIQSKTNRDELTNINCASAEKQDYSTSTQYNYHIEVVMAAWPHYATLRFQHNVSWSVGGEDANVVPKQRPELGKDIEVVEF